MQTLKLSLRNTTDYGKFLRIKKAQALVWMIVDQRQQPHFWRPEWIEAAGSLEMMYRAHIRLTISLQDDEGKSTRVPFVAAVMQKGSGFKYHVKAPHEMYLIGMDGRNDFSEASFMIWGNRSAISRFVSIFIVLIMWILSIIIFTQTLYIVWYRKLDKVIEMASFTATVLFALPQLRSTQPGIPTEANLVIDMTGFIWNMAMVSIACIIYLYIFYSTLVEENGNDKKPTELPQMEEQPPREQTPQMEEQLQIEPTQQFEEEPQTAGQKLQTEEQPQMGHQ
ncbi:hypothetical protein Vretimale_19596 [Volvox reticuliferus]|uniref:Uncharacterized protein n=1 Tax=Volvox reticuliferus TaxID=1737510 RepID=A0A8J4D6X7_9CHLO|nr:hypothetical protein Vretifemale_20631 [Volvox reticuliferus]GIM17060.1 hypothetical protein Vretimale_19596 [Volvox reticuliferus]